MISITAVENSHDLDASLYHSFFELASEERKQRVARFLKKEDACRSIVGEVLAKYCVGKAAGVPPDTISFRIDSFGKPHADLREKEIQFSVSHSGSWVVCAVGEGMVGIDVERVRKYDQDIAKRFYHPIEYAALIALPEHERTGRFFDLWTIKESYIKAIGKGLSQALDSFEILFENNAIRMQTLSGNPIMHFKQYDHLGPEYKCAVCACHDNFPKEINIVTPETILSSWK